MKLSTIFKKETASVNNPVAENSGIQILDKKQLEKVTGGSETPTAIPEPEATNGKRAVLSGHSGGWS